MHAYNCNIEHPYKPKCTCGAEDRFAEQRADDDGMPPPYIRLDSGINEPRILSWAELRALEEDLRLSVDPVGSARLGRTVYRYPMVQSMKAIYGSSGP